MRNAFLASAMLLLLVTNAPPARAAPCAGFPDVDTTSAFCPNVEWIRNRSITLGCLTGGFCPSDPVDRLSMAAFLNRLGTALTPEVVPVFEGTGVVDLDQVRNSAAGTFCKSSVLTYADFPRKAVVNAHWTGLPAGSAMVFTTIMVSSDGGQTYGDLAPFGMRDTGDGSWMMTAQTYAMDLAVGESYVFAIGVERAIEDAGNVDLSQSRCNLVVTVHNRNGTSPPRDATSQSADNRR